MPLRLSRHLDDCLITCPHARLLQAPHVESSYSCCKTRYCRTSTVASAGKQRAYQVNQGAERASQTMQPAVSARRASMGGGVGIGRAETCLALARSAVGRRDQRPHRMAPQLADAAGARAAEAPCSASEKVVPALDHAIIIAVRLVRARDAPHPFLGHHAAVCMKKSLIVVDDLHRTRSAVPLCSRDLCADTDLDKELHAA